MLIDWFTVAAQALNFLILVWLLKRILYQPVLAAITARESKIAAQLADAAVREAQAKSQREELEERNAAFDRERDALMRKVADEAAAERRRLMDLARSDSQGARAKLTESLLSERLELARELTVRAQAEILALARQALSELAGVSLEDRMVEVFLERFQALPVDQLRTLRQDSTGDSATASEQVALVRSAFELPPARRAAVEAAVRGRLGPGSTLHFEVWPECVSGIELRLDGVRVAWSVSDYLASVSRVASEMLESAQVRHAP